MWRCVLLLSLVLSGCRFTVDGEYGSNMPVGGGGPSPGDGDDGGVVAPDLLPATDLMPVDPCGMSGPLVEGDAEGQCAVGTTVTIDGNLTDWMDATFTTLTKANAAFSKGTWSGTPAVDDANSSGSFAVKWDPTYLYIAARVNDDVRGVFPASPSAAQDDSVQIFLDGDHARTDGAFNADDHDLIITPDGRSQDAQYGQQPHALPTGVQFAVGQGPAQGYTVEVAVPFSALGNAAAQGGRTIGLDFAISDDDSTSVQVQARLLVWKFIMPATGCKTSPSCNTQIFGDLQLLGH
jgi:hypothetical protein